MCPVCLAAAALLAVKATSGSALAALAYRKIHGNLIEPGDRNHPASEEDDHVSHNDSN